MLALGTTALMMSSGFVVPPQPKVPSTSLSILQSGQNQQLPEVSITDCNIAGTRCYIMPTVTIKL